MSTDDENLYRGDPPPPPPPATPPMGHGQPAPQPYGQPGFVPPGYAPPGYAPPGYGQPGYPPPGYGYPPVYVRPTNTMAILALVMAFVFAPAGLILGIVARKQIRQTGEDGDGLALAGIIVGGIVTAIFAFFIVFWIAAFASVTSSFGP
jgi:hypothetical protein